MFPKGIPGPSGPRGPSGLDGCNGTQVRLWLIDNFYHIEIYVPPSNSEKQILIQTRTG